VVYSKAGLRASIALPGATIAASVADCRKNDINQATPISGFAVALLIERRLQAK